MADVVVVCGVTYRRTTAFWAKWCCGLHPKYEPRIVGWELERVDG